MSQQAVAVDALECILRACEHLRRLPASRWQLPPLPPMGSRPVGEAVDLEGAPLERRVREAVIALMADDADARGVPAFEPSVPVFSLPDVLAALAISVTARADERGAQLLRRVADDVGHW